MLSGGWRRSEVNELKRDLENKFLALEKRVKDLEEFEQEHRDQIAEFKDRLRQLKDVL